MRGYGSNPQVAATILPLSDLDRSVLHSDYDQEFLELPKECGEGALVDCASSMPRLTRIFIPVAVPGMMAAIILCFTVSWGNFLLPPAFTANQSVLPARIVTTPIRDNIDLDGRAVRGAPPLISYALLMDYYISGLTAGARKG
jgi:multiple sugar transport system permease protein